MLRLCLATMINLIFQAKVSGTTVEKICDAIFSVYGLNFQDCGSTKDHLKNGHDDATRDLKNAANPINTPLKVTKANFIKYICPLIRPEYQEALIKSIQEILRADETIDDEAIVGYGKGYEKRSLINKNTFYFSETMLSVLTYAIVNKRSTDCQDAVKLISKNKNFLNEVKNNGRKIYLEEKALLLGLPIKATLHDPDFDKAFIKRHEEVLDTTNPTRVSVFTVGMGNKQFKFKNATEFIMDNLSSYVMSREVLNHPEKQKNPARLGIDALRKLTKEANLRKDEALGDIFLYIFLEQVLGAPKIMSKLELNSVPGESHTDGMHLMQLKKEGLPFKQIIFGAAKIVNSLNDAINSVFDKVVRIENQSDDELQILDYSIGSRLFSQEDSEAIREFLIPQKQTGLEPERAYACFIGYTLQLDPSGMSNAQYIEKVVEQTKSDMNMAVKFIKERIIKLDLSDYDFYFYFVPFNNANDERISIINEITASDN